MSNNKKYPSKYSNGKLVSEAQFITEIICERIAKKENKDLHYRFWLSKNWEKQFKGQIASANKLLNTYPINDIIDALKSYKGQKIYSLRAPHLPAIIEEVASKRPKVDKTINKTHDIKRNMLESGSKKTKTNNILDKLRGIEDDSNNTR
jgi:hypothetical protein